MIRADLLAIVVKLAAAITDSNGYHFRAPQAAVAAIVDATLADDVLGDERATAAVLVVFAAHESSFQLSPNGSNDHGHACGPWQHWGDGEQCLRLRRDWAYAAKIALVDLRRSALANPSHPFAAYCGNPFGAVAIKLSDDRAAEVRRLLALVTTTEGGGT